MVAPRKKEQTTSAKETPVLLPLGKLFKTIAIGEGKAGFAKVSKTT